MTSLQAPKQRVSLHYAVATDNGAVLPIKGQGTVSIKPDVVDDTLRFVFTTEAGSALEVAISRTRFSIDCRTGSDLTNLVTSKDEKLLLTLPELRQPYWVSIDSNNMRVRYGKGEMLRHLMLLEFQWDTESTYALKDFSKDLRHVDIKGTVKDHLRVMQIPVTLDPPPTVIPTSAITMEVIAGNSASVVNDLSPVCQRLYANVAGPGITLNSPDFPEFAQAIQYSIVTEGALCNSKLKKKEEEFGYLRITLDTNMGDSPGQPYVLEIWPAGNGSPIHDHGKACAVIKVLHGQIQVSWFSSLSPKLLTPWGSMIAHAGDVTFLTPDYYQIHQLKNPSPKAGGDFCATIQCYRYPDDDEAHYEYFDYIENGQIEHFSPDSDWEYLDFKKKIREEWGKAMETAAK
ncbi:cysteine dioxygenase [Duganella phyllosphaerae]|uniref:ApaG domain-containing protein n=1 Tax=Duganella phyllosphaerae TaxID=762836 RepID=A0A1E7WBQ8_9BURK|nr:cysteine dioxygenase family protein [Duganella phyllosphaerae]OEZ94315.1 hypothetical protein DUPY_46510 [Duganella phyllosphaerae]